MCDVENSSSSFAKNGIPQVPSFQPRIGGQKHNRIPMVLPSGKHTKNIKKLWKDPPFCSWENSLYLWPCSIAFCMFTRPGKSTWILWLRGKETLGVESMYRPEVLLGKTDSERNQKTDHKTTDILVVSKAPKEIPPVPAISVFSFPTSVNSVNRVNRVSSLKADWCQTRMTIISLIKKKKYYRTPIEVLQNHMTHIDKYDDSRSKEIQGALVVTEDVSKFLLFEGHLLGHFLQGIAGLAEVPDGLLVIFTSERAAAAFRGASRCLPVICCDGCCVKPS